MVIDKKNYFPIGIKTTACNMLLQKMFRAEYFDLTPIWDIKRLLNVDPEKSKHFDVLYAYHCAKFTDIPESIIERLPLLVVACFDNKLVIDDLIEFTSYPPGAPLITK